MALAGLRGCVLSRITSVVSRQAGVFDRPIRVLKSEASRGKRPEYDAGDRVWMDYWKPRLRGDIDEDGYDIDHHDDVDTGEIDEDNYDIPGVDADRRYDLMYDAIYTTSDFGDVDEEERKKRMADLVHYYQSVDLLTSEELRSWGMDDG